MAAISVSKLVLSICPKRVLSELPAFSSTAGGDTCRDTAIRSLGSDATFFASVSKRLEISAQISVGKGHSASSVAILTLLCFLFQSNIKHWSFWKDISDTILALYRNRLHSRLVCLGDLVF